MNRTDLLLAEILDEIQQLKNELSLKINTLSSANAQINTSLAQLEEYICVLDLQRLESNG